MHANSLAIINSFIPVSRKRDNRVGEKSTPMSTLEMLDALIGLVFIFLLLSLICSALNEIIENILKKRASDLEAGIRELLQDIGKEGNGKVEELYKHSLIAGLYKGPYVPFGKNLPSYIPASNFALALLDNILPASSNNLSGSVGGAALNGDTPQSKSLAPLRNEIINKWPESASKRALLTLIDAAGNDINKARENIENWYNSSMDRVAGWYKRRVQKILIVLGFVLAVVMNADTIVIFKSLISDPPLRNSLVAAAQEYAKSPTLNDTSTIAQRRVSENARKIYGYRLPIGWDWDNTSIDQSNKRLAIPWSVTNNNESIAVRWLLKVIGWLITALAVSLGASFWFDILNKIMVIRSTVKPHEKSPEESSEDRQNPKPTVVVAKN